MKRLFVLAALLAASAACGHDSPAAPTAPSATAETRVIALSGNLAFGNVTVGSTATATLHIANTGNAALTVTAVQANGSISGVVHAEVTGGAIAAGASRDVTVTFAPAAAQAYSGTLVVNGDQTSGTNTIAISGTGVAAAFSISGVVNDGTTGPSGRIAGATVSVTDGANNGKSATTDANGQYVMTGLAAGTMTITASAADYSSVDKSVTLSGNLALDFSLTRNGAPPSNPGTPAPPSNPGNPPNPPSGGGQTSFGDGQYRVNTDIRPGRYFTNPVYGCYFERQSGFSGSLDDIIANNFIGFDAAQWIVDIAGSDAGFKTDDCGTWTTSPRGGSMSSIAPGMWLVGQQVSPGTYSANASYGCYWERLSGFGNSFDNIIDNDFVDAAGQAIVEIRSGDAGFDANADCGTWTKTSGLSTDRVGARQKTRSEIDANRRRHRAEVGRP
ncbi:MAG TPA: choice-of-anchor D domain-containing protein [Vicinamibacterales bacterium]|nr:choice-of-anchor D domain-containing protein [Vicinamibacterales bacterium]